MAKSPYAKYQKQPYQYVFKRCSHNHSHVEHFSAVDSNRVGVRGKVRICDVCHITLAPAFQVQTRILPQPRSDND